MSPTKQILMNAQINTKRNCRSLHYALLSVEKHFQEWAVEARTSAGAAPPVLGSVRILSQPFRAGLTSGGPALRASKARRAGGQRSDETW